MSMGLLLEGGFVSAVLQDLIISGLRGCPADHVANRERGQEPDVLFAKAPARDDLVGDLPGCNPAGVGGQERSSLLLYKMLYREINTFLIQRYPIFIALQFYHLLLFLCY